MIANVQKNNGKTTILCRTHVVFFYTIQVILNDNDLIEDVIFIGGCQGNARAVNRLIKGMTVEQVINTLEGVECSDKGTSCTDQLAKCLKEYLEK